VIKCVREENAYGSVDQRIEESAINLIAQSRSSAPLSIFRSGTTANLISQDTIGHTVALAWKSPAPAPSGEHASSLPASSTTCSSRMRRADDAIRCRARVKKWSENQPFGHLF